MDMRRRITFLAVAFLIAAIAAVVVVTLRLSRDDAGPSQSAAPQAVATATQPARPEGATGSLSPADPGNPVSTAEPQGIDVARIVVPTLGIDAPIITLGIDANGAMLSPDNPVDVAWYSFSALPGEGSNVVMAGHLDFVNYGPAVFSRLKDAQSGDEVHLMLVDGSTARYRVLDVTTYDEATAPVQQIVGPTDREIVTLITCGGAFDPLAREYNKRVVLRAERIADIAQAN